MKHPHPEDPREMDAILKIIGAEPVNWSYKYLHTVSSPAALMAVEPPRVASPPE